MCAYKWTDVCAYVRALARSLAAHARTYENKVDSSRLESTLFLHVRSANAMLSYKKVSFYFNFWRSKLVSCERVATDTAKSQSYFSLWRSNLVSCERVVADTSKSQFYLSLWRSNLVSCEMVVILLQFVAIESRFVRNSCRRHFQIAI